MAGEENSIQILIGTAKFKCSKEVLMNHSDYFRAMFTSNMREAHEDSISLQEVDPTAFQVLLDFMESQTMNISDETMYEVMKAAMMFQVSEILPICESYILSKLDISNAVDIYVFADTYNTNKIYNLARHLILWKFSSLKCNKCLLILSTEQFIDLLTDSQLRVSSEEEVLASIFFYLKRKGGSKRMAKEILVDSAYSQFLSSDNLGTEQASRDFTYYKEIFATLKERCSAEGREVKKRKVKKDLLIYGPWTQEVNGTVTRTDPKLVRYDRDEPVKFLHFDDVPVELHPDMNWSQDTGLGVTLHEHMLYFVGGVADLYRSRWFKDVWLYDLMRRKWKKVTELRNPRRHHGQCIVGDFLYVIGGIGKYRVKQSMVEKYNLKTDEWFDCKPLPSPGYKVTTWFKDNVITVSMNAAPKQHAMYLYDTDADTWQEIPSPEERVQQIIDGGEYGAIDTTFASDIAMSIFEIDQSNQPAKFSRWISFVPCFLDFRKT